MADGDKDSFAALFGEAEKAGRRRAEPRIGDRVDVVVTKIGKDAVFVALDGKQEGYIERSDLADKQGNLAVTEGATIVARVAETGGKAGATRLEPLVIRRSQDEDALATAAPSLNSPVLEVGLKVKGTVSRVERYGVFVQIAGTGGRKGRGLVPVSESGTPRGADLHKAFPVGSEIEAKITRIEEDGKIRLSVTELRRDEERGEFESFQGAGAGGAGAAGGPTDKADKARTAESRGRAPQSLGTFGDLLAKKGIGAKR